MVIKRVFTITTTIQQVRSFYHEYICNKYTMVSLALFHFFKEIL